MAKRGTTVARSTPQARPVSYGRVKKYYRVKTNRLVTIGSMIFLPSKEYQVSDVVYDSEVDGQKFADYCVWAQPV